MLLPQPYINFFNQTKDSEIDSYKRLLKASQINPAINGGTYNERLAVILKEQNRFFVAVMGQLAFINSSHANKKCMFHYIQYSIEFTSFPIRKNFPFKEKLNLFVHYANEAGLGQKYSFFSNCETVVKRDKGLIRINIFEFCGCLFILLIGVFVGLAVFFFEIVICQIHKLHRFVGFNLA